MTDTAEALAAGEQLRLIEALIFASGEPLTEDKIAGYLPPETPVTARVAELQQHYRFRGINLVRVAGGWSFRTAPDLSGFLSVERVEARKLTRAQIETLAIIAYHQPLTRAEIEEVRGVSLHRGTLDLLIEAGWVSPQGRRESPGQPILWGTTPAFLSHFGFDSLRDLPKLEELRATGLLDVRPAAILGEGREQDTGTAALPGEEEL